MDYNRQSNGLRTFLEHFWFVFIPVVAWLAALMLGGFARLSGMEWIWCYVFALTVAVVGVGLIFYAKLPLYRQRQFFTFGSNALPAQRRSFYRWGYACAAFAIVLLCCLFLSRP